MKNLHPPAYEDGTDSVPKRRLLKLRRRGITQKGRYYSFYLFTNLKMNEARKIRRKEGRREGRKEGRKEERTGGKQERKKESVM